MDVNNMQSEAARKFYISPAVDVAEPLHQNQGLIIQ